MNPAPPVTNDVGISFHLKFLTVTDREIALAFSSCGCRTCRHLWFDSTFQELDGIEHGIPADYEPIHIQPALQGLARFEPAQHAIECLANAEVKKYDLPATPSSCWTKVFVKVAIAISRRLDGETGWKASNGLSTQVRDCHRWRVADGMTGLPDSIAKVDFFVVKEKLLVKSIDTLEQVAANQHAASGLPVDISLLIAVPTHVFVGKKSAPKKTERPQTKCRNQRSANCGERTCRPLVCAIRVQYFAS